MSAGTVARPAGATEASSTTAEHLRQVFRNHAASVAVITVGGARPTGFTATSVVSVAQAPALVSFNIAHASSSWPSVHTADHLAIHLLAEDQQQLATTFATSGIDRLAHAPGWRIGPRGLPVLPDVSALLITRVHSSLAAGDHEVVIAELLEVSLQPTRPLVHHAGRYVTVGY